MSDGDGKALLFLVKLGWKMAVAVIVFWFFWHLIIG
jgi:hypothetical protein